MSYDTYAFGSYAFISSIILPLSLQAFLRSLRKASDASIESKKRDNKDTSTEQIVQDIQLDPSPSVGNVSLLSPRAQALDFAKVFAGTDFSTTRKMIKKFVITGGPCSGKVRLFSTTHLTSVEF
jgi:hypothetical protein